MRLTPNRLPTKLMRKKATKATTSPMIAATICFLASSTLVLSPPERIHLMPPIIRNTTAVTTATIRRMTMVLEITSPTLLWLKVPCGHRASKVLVPLWVLLGQGLMTAGSA